MLSQCSLVTNGISVVADVNQIKRARYCIQVVLCALYQTLLHPLQWLEEKSKTSGMCYFWRMVINLQIEILIFVPSLREGNFPVYVQTTRKLLKWFFALDHYNYARWLTVYVFDLLSLPITHPGVYQNMIKGCFSFAKSHQFSRIALDQVHEQNNKVIKGQGAAASVLNSQNDSALILWETCGPEVARIVSEFEELIDNYCSSERSSGTKYHEVNENFRTNFLKDSTMCLLKDTMQSIWNRLLNSPK